MSTTTRWTGSIMSKDVVVHSPSSGSMHSKDEVVEVPEMDSGLTAWLQVLGCWILFMWTWGLTNSYGVFETYYIEVLLSDSSPSAISWIGSIQAFLTSIVGVFVGCFLDAGYLRSIIATGTALEVFGMLMTSIGTKYWHMLLSQGICVGLGSGLLGITSVSVLPHWFKSRRMLATGIATTGSSVAGIVFPIMLQTLFRHPNIGFAWGVRILALVMLVTLSLCFMIMRLRVLPTSRREIPSLSLLKDMPYSLLIIACTFMLMGVFVPFFFVSDYAHELGVSTEMAFYILAIMNAGSLLGRLAPNFLADYVGGITVIVPCSLLSGLVIFIMRFLSTLPSLVTMAIVYGLISGGMISLPPAIIANLTKDSKDLGVRVGLAYSLMAVGVLVGNPISGATRLSQYVPGDVESIQRQFEGIWYFAGAVLILSTGFLVACWWTERRRRDGAKSVTHV